MPARSGSRASGRRSVPGATNTRTSSRRRSTTISSSRRAPCIAAARSHGARNQRHALHLHIQDVGLGPPRPRRQAATDPSRTRPRQHSMGSHNGMGEARTRQPLRAARFRRMAGARSAPACTSASSSRRAGIGSRRCRTTRRRSTCSISSKAMRRCGSPTGQFAPFVVHYAETFIVPAAVGQYTIRPHGRSLGRRLATVKAWVRGTSM